MIRRALLLTAISLTAAPPLYWWRVDEGASSERSNFGDELSRVIVERLVGASIERADRDDSGKLLAIGSILQFAQNGDIVWGSGINGKHPDPSDYHFDSLDVRAVRGPLTARFLADHFGIETDISFGDPALLLPTLFPEFHPEPKRDYIVIPNINPMEMSRVTHLPESILPTEPWETIIRAITESRFVISSSLHGIVVAEAFGIPARFLRLTQHEPDCKYTDYYLATGREGFTPAHSIEEALELGGEPPPDIDIYPLSESFPFDAFE